MDRWARRAFHQPHRVDLKETTMRSQIEFALAHPVFDPRQQIVQGHYWRADRDVSAALTVNIGME